MGTKSKILVLSQGSIYERQGMFNAMLCRTKHLIAKDIFDIDVLLLSTYEPWYIRKLRHSKKADCPDSASIDGVDMKIAWINFSLLNYFATTKWHYKEILPDYRRSSILKIIRDYDFVIAHSLQAGEIALEAKQKWNIPYSVTWHGSDIHTLPMNNKWTFHKTKLVIEGANINFFVSKALKEKSDKISIKGNKDILYNGCDRRFYRYTDNQRRLLRKQYNVLGKKVVSFVGNFFEVKNILKVPLIFKSIYEKDDDVVFWMFGDGKYRVEVEQLIKSLPVKLWGNVTPEKIPDFLNCTDVQILPSKNEGLPLTMVEALKCGCHAVGSMVGGIPEVIGCENCVPLESPNFEDQIANRVYYLLNEGANDTQDLSPCFDWNVAAEKEQSAILRILSN